MLRNSKRFDYFKKAYDVWWGFNTGNDSVHAQFNYFKSCSFFFAGSKIVSCTFSLPTLINYFFTYSCYQFQKTLIMHIKL